MLDYAKHTALSRVWRKAIVAASGWGGGISLSPRIGLQLEETIGDSYD